ncbi:MAG: acyl carrier protein [Hyphomonas sp. 32-62-5]|nr:MAG: acyl carrier protein [Hyphomonas sp. 32-62-5]
MTEQEMLGHISRLVAQIIDDKGLDAPEITADTELLDGGVGIDSLDLAMLVRDLEEVAGHDPFSEGFIEFRTAGELAKLYAR